MDSGDSDEKPSEGNETSIEDHNVRSEEEASTIETPPHPIGAAINHALHRCRDIEAAARIMVPASISVLQDMWKSADLAFTTAKNKLEARPDEEEIDEVVAAELDEAAVALGRLSESNLPDTLLVSLFLGLFSAFDAFTGKLLLAIYKKKPILLEALNVEVPLSELLRHDSFDDLKDTILADEIENFRRKSYVEQFEMLEKRFGITLKKFDHWSDFVEIGQRRNLITHCEGIISKQYLKICRENGVILNETVKEGGRLDVDFKYLLEACSVIFEVSLKLGQTLWRKIFPDESEEADEQLTDTIYESLRLERWGRAILLSEFATSIQKEIRDLARRIRVVNHCIALRFSGKIPECEALLSKEDWSAASLDFQLAVSVLNESFSNAAEIMLQIGKKGALVNQKAYHVWPLFRDFRKSEIFTKVYKDIYGTSYGEDVVEEKSRAEEKGQEKIVDGKVDSELVDPGAIRPNLDDIKRLLG